MNHIGTWHSHHKFSLDRPSEGDADSLFYGMKEDGLETFLHDFTTDIPTRHSAVETPAASGLSHSF